MSEAAVETATMIRLHRTGPAEVLQYDRLPVPSPGSGEIRMRVRAIGLNRAEVMFREGNYFEAPILPARIGGEASGIIDAVGPGVQASWVGKSVVTVPGQHSYNRQGVYGEVAVLPLERIAEFPPTLSYEEAAAIPNQYFTAYGALVWLAKLTPRDVVLIGAASSSVGLAAINIVKAEGAASIALTRTAAKRDALMAAGADHVIAVEEDDLVTKVNEVTAGAGARIILDPVAGRHFEALASAAAPQAVIVLYGGLAMAEPTSIPPLPMIAKQLTVRGYRVSELLAAGQIETAKRYIFDRLASGTFRPNIARVFPFSAFVDAHRYLESNRQVGKVVVSLERELA